MKRIVVAAVAASCLITAAHGQNIVSRVSEEDFLAVLDDAYVAVVARREPIGAAEAAVAAARRLDNPRFEAAQENPSGPSEQLDLTLSWQLPRPDRRPSIRASEKTAAAAIARFDGEKLELRLELRSVYSEWALSAERTALLADQADRLGELARRERERAELGEASGLEAARLELAASDMRARLAVADAGEQRAAAAARGWHPGLPPDAGPRLPDLPPVPEGLPADHPRLRALTADLEAATFARIAAERFLATPELTVGWQQQDLGVAKLDGPLLGISWPLPLADRKQPQQLLATTREEAARARLEEARRRISADREGALAAFETLVGATRRASADVANEDLVDAAVAAFESGESDLTDLLAALDAVLEARTTALDLHAAALEAHRELERAAGQALLLHATPGSQP